MTERSRPEKTEDKKWAGETGDAEQKGADSECVTYMTLTKTNYWVSPIVIRFFRCMYTP